MRLVPAAASPARQATAGSTAASAKGFPALIGATGAVVPVSSGPMHPFGKPLIGSRPGRLTFPRYFASIGTARSTNPADRILNAGQNQTRTARAIMTRPRAADD